MSPRRAPLLAALICLAPVVLPAQAPGRAVTLPSARFEESVTAPVRPHAYVGVVGRAAAAFGVETGSFEVWAWPLKLLNGFELSFRTPLYDAPIEGRDVARTVTVTPAGASITYAHAAFTVRQHLFAPLEEPAVVCVLEVEAVRPLEVIVRFKSRLTLAWPGSVGGQYVLWDDAEKAFLLSESRREINAFVGSPYATWATNHPAHALPDAPSEMHIQVGDAEPIAMPRPGEPAGRLTDVHARGIPIVFTAAIAPRDSVRARYRRILSDIPHLYEERVAHARRVLATAVGVRTPDSLINRGVPWAVINLDEALACNPDLGCGLVAGYGPSGPTGARPGFGWYFGGDASINSLAMSLSGLHEVARDGLGFFARYQREDGKIAHEISHAARRIPWFDAFPYAFYHGDTTPFWILAVARYWRASADTAFLREMWPGVARAFAWSKATDLDGDGLMENAAAGAGAIEVGDLQVGLKTDVYLAGVWTAALAELSGAARAVGAESMAVDAEGWRERASRSLADRLWHAGEGRYAFALLEGDSVSGHLSVWPATALSFGLMPEERGRATARHLARATITTDWGARTLAATSPLFDPLHYNNGTVWPFVTGFHALGLYKYGNADAAFASLYSVARSGFIWGWGHNPEVFSGSSFEPLDTSVPHQFFATSQLLTALIGGLLGWEPDAPGRRARLEPRLPGTWDSLEVERLPLGRRRLSVRLLQNDTSFTAALRAVGSGVDTIFLAPSLPAGSEITHVRIDGNPAPYRAGGPIVVSDRTVVEIFHTRGYRVLLDPPRPMRGDHTAALKLLDARVEGGRLVLDVEGPAGEARTVRVRGPAGERSVEIVFPEPGDPVDGYVRRRVVVDAR